MRESRKSRPFLVCAMADGIAGDGLRRYLRECYFLYLAVTGRAGSPAVFP